MTKYNLVHITTGGEYKTPLVASQLFDQAENQAIKKIGFAPAHVAAWIIGSMREYFDEPSKQKVSTLRKRCPHIAIRFINGIDRIGKFPVSWLLWYYRMRLGKSTPVIYHCRGEGAAQWGIRLKKMFPGDKVVLDVRGYWPAELLYTRNIDEPELATGDDREAYLTAYNFLKETIARVDAVTTVSESLRDVLIRETGAPADTSVVPCCINAITNESSRAEIRKSWGLGAGDIAIVYSGTTAAYQHLSDLTFPFVKKLLEVNDKVKLVLLSPEPEKISLMCSHAGIDLAKVIVENLPQEKVARALTACDAGILIRKPTLVNRVANPVKIAEYLGAGLPVIMQQGVGGVPQRLYDISVIKGINISSTNSSFEFAAAEVNLWLQKDMAAKREMTRNIASEIYLWSSAIDISRNMYQRLLLSLV